MMMDKAERDRVEAEHDREFQLMQEKTGALERLTQDYAKGRVIVQQSGRERGYGVYLDDAEIARICNDTTHFEAFIKGEPAVLRLETEAELRNWLDATIAAALLRPRD